jgi:hypothetical protein
MRLGACFCKKKTSTPSPIEGPGIVGYRGYCGDLQVVFSIEKNSETKHAVAN